MFRATGQGKYKDFLGSIEGLELDRSGRVVIQEDGKYRAWGRCSPVHATAVTLKNA